MLEIQNLSYKYAVKPVLKNVSVKLETGLYLLLGPNGAGKTTFINILAGLLKPQSGRLLWNGTDLKDSFDEYLTHVGYSPQHPGFYNNYTVYEFLEYIFRIRDGWNASCHKKIIDILEYVNLLDQSSSRIRTLSGGMKQRLSIAQALLGNPEFVILDEPTAGLDPLERKYFHELVEKIAEKRLVLVATHLIYDLKDIDCTVLMLKDGSICCNSTLSQLISNQSADTLEDVYIQCYGGSR